MRVKEFWKSLRRVAGTRPADQSPDEGEASVSQVGVEAKVVVMPVHYLAGRTGDANQRHRDLLKRADVILGHDPIHGNLAVFYGKGLLEDIAANRGSEFCEEKLVVGVELDFSDRTVQLEFLYAAVEHLKGEGRCCYQPS
jgi:hypothetical protein